MIKSVVLALVTASAGLLATPAHAGGGVSWSVGINTPPVTTVIAGGPGYYRHGYGRVYAPLPVYAAPPVYVPAPPVAYYPAPVYYRPAPVYYRPAPVVVYPRYGHPGWRHDHRWDGRR